MTTSCALPSGQVSGRFRSRPVYGRPVSLLDRPDRIESREAFVAFLDAMLTSLDQAIRNPAIPYRHAVDDRGKEWKNTSLAGFLQAVDAWMTRTGWTELDRRE